jgi:hypothetical protein
MFSNVGKKCFKLWCVLCAVQFESQTVRCNNKNWSLIYDEHGDIAKFLIVCPATW